MPVELHSEAAGPFDDGVEADGIFERLDDYVGAGGASGFNGLVHVCDEVAGALGAEWIGNGSLEGEDGENAARAYYRLKLCAAGNGQDVVGGALRSRAPESGDEAFYEGVEIGGSEVDVSRIVLRANGDDGSIWRGSGLGLRASGVRRSEDERSGDNACGRGGDFSRGRKEPRAREEADARQL